MTPHGKLRKEICEYLTSIGAWWYATNSQGYGRKGIPDVLFCLKGRFGALEVKVNRDTPSPWQLRELQAIRDAAGNAEAVYSLDEAKIIIAHVAAGTKFSGVVVGMRL